MRGLMMDSPDGRQIQGLEEAYAVAIPEATRSYQPVSNQQLIEHVKDQVKGLLDPTHEEFQDRNAWSLYNAFTESLKRGCGGNRMEKQAKAHQFLMVAA